MFWFIENDKWGECVTAISDLQKGGSGLFVLLDENTRKYCLPRLIQRMKLPAGYKVLEIPPGESYKTLETAMTLWARLLASGADRQSVLINLGGGVICDMGGFVASVYQRGIRFFHIPTTLLAQVDASIGGKTGVDFFGYKNQLGLFSKAEGVIIDPGFLETLGGDQFRSGWGEVVKMALVMDEGLWGEIRERGTGIGERGTGNGEQGSGIGELGTGNGERGSGIGEVIRRVAELKMSVVERDYRETGLRKILNFGHTVGHALETLYLEKGRALLHGDAVAAGIVCESILSVKAGLLSRDIFEDIREYMAGHFPAIHYTLEEIPKLTDIMRHDKKNRGGNILFTLLSAIGKGETDQAVSGEQLTSSLTEYLTSF
ncbi:MAG: 3-dehydroquinate synthase [Bacteroidetes bacterium]|nr:3-dehydroquinate synthase [Bacteroidota bacterium]